MRRTVIIVAMRLLGQPRMLPLADDQPRPSDSSARGMIDEEMIQQVRGAIARLPEHFRAALVLCEYEDMSYADIAQTLNASVPQVKTWIHRARRQMEGMLKEYVEGKRKGEDENVQGKT